MRIRSHTPLAVAFAACALLGISAAGPAGCFYPDYSFDRNPTGGPGGGPSSGPGMGGETSTSSTKSGQNTTSGGLGGSTGSNGGGGEGGGGTACGADGKCVDQVPMNWMGYFTLFDGPVAKEPGCPSAYSMNGYLGNGGLTFVPAKCNCTCGDPMNEVCTPPTSVDINDATCGHAPRCQAQLALTNWNGTCFFDNMCAAGNNCGPTSECTGGVCMGGGGAGSGECNVSVVLGEATVAAGTCTPSAIDTMMQPATWSTLGKACGGGTSEPGKCSGDQVCMPASTSPFVKGLCVMQTGDVMCPAGAFTDKHLFYLAMDDERTCTGTCNCNASSGGKCTATMHLYDDESDPTQCQGQVTQVDSGKCVNLTAAEQVQNLFARKGTVSAVTGSSCTPDYSQTMASGTVTGTTPTTFCCIP